jgi:hypothetical protein
MIGTPFFSALAQRAIVDYPIFGIYLTRNYTGTLSLGQSINTIATIARALTSGPPLKGAIDSGVVNNISNIEWHDVVPFAPQGASNNVSSYLYWALQLSSISVSLRSARSLSTSLIGSTQVNGTSFTPVPTYPSVTPDIGSLAILDV